LSLSLSPSLSIFLALYMCWYLANLSFHMHDEHKLMQSRGIWQCKHEQKRRCTARNSKNSTKSFSKTKNAKKKCQKMQKMLLHVFFCNLRSIWDFQAVREIGLRCW